MDELEIRRLYISDEEWERTSESWKALKPFRNFNQIRQTDETEQKYFERLQPQYKIPIEVMKQWIYPHYYDRNTVNNYGWLNYTSSAFQLEEFTVEMILQRRKKLGGRRKK
jgi:DNA-binding GntR family transcriptional regulator